MKYPTQAPPKWMYILPNAFTLGSLFAGFYAITLVTSNELSGNNFLYAAIALMVATICDLLDGRVARMTHTQSEFGLHMDSLVDLVSFGLAPAVLVYKWSLHEFGTIGLVVAFVFAACGACRLARFNVLELKEKGKKTGPSRYFVGLPTPLAASMLVSVIVLIESMNLVASSSLPWGIAGLTALLGVLMVSNVRFRTFKDLRFTSSTVVVLTLLVSLLVLSAIHFQQPSLSLVVLFASYILSGLLGELFGFWHRLLKTARATSK